MITLGSLFDGIGVWNFTVIYWSGRKDEREKFPDHLHL